MVLVYPVASWNPVSQGGGGGTFNPLSLNPTMWIGGGNTSNFTLQNTDQITQASDLSGNNTHATPVNTTPANCPTIITSGLNNKTIINFDGASNYLRTTKNLTQTLSASNYTVFCVGRATTISTDAGLNYTNDSFWGDSLSYVGNYLRSSGIIGAYNWGAGNTITTQGYTAGHWVIACVQLRANRIRMQIDGGAETSSPSSGISAMSGTMNIGTTGNNTQYTLTGQIADFQTFNYALTQSQIDQMFGYLAHFWLLQSLLPVNHPYKNSSP